MRILVISNLFPPRARGGAERVASEVARALFDAGHEVSVLTGAPRVTFRALAPRPDDESGLRVYRLFPLNIASYENLGKLAAPLRVLWRVLDLVNLHAAVIVFLILRSVKPEVVLSHNLLGLGWLLPLIIRCSRIRWVHTIHDVQLVAPSGILRPEKEKTAGGLFAWMSRLQYGSPDAVVSPSQWLLDFYVSRKFFPKSKKAILRNPIQILNSKFQIPDSRILCLLYAGQIEEHKGILWLVEALRNFRGEFELRIVGGGARLAHLRRITAGDARFMIRGPVAPEQLRAYFAEADMTVVPSLAFENCPGVILESLAVGTPVLASHVGGIPELVTEGKNGWLFAPGDAEDLRSRISFCLQNRALLSEMREGARESVNQFSMGRYLELLASLLSRQV